MIPTELDETADVHGDDLSDAAKQCRFRAWAQWLENGERLEAAQIEWEA